MYMSACARERVCAPCGPKRSLFSRFKRNASPLVCDGSCHVSVWRRLRFERVRVGCAKPSFCILNIADASSSGESQQILHSSVNDPNDEGRFGGPSSHGQRKAVCVANSCQHFPVEKKRDTQKHLLHRLNPPATVTQEVTVLRRSAVPRYVSNICSIANMAVVKNDTFAPIFRPSRTPPFMT